ncbi:MAG TPA: tetratricopeptide repeat protein [Polyangiaceae bacterium]
MTAVLLHPEELLDKSRAGRLSAVERRQLDHHLAQCDGCALELEVGEKLALAASTLPGDGELLERTAIRVTDELERGETGHARRWRRVLLAPATAAVAVVLIAGGAAAGYLAARVRTGLTLRSGDDGASATSVRVRETAAFAKSPDNSAPPSAEVLSPMPSAEPVPAPPAPRAATEPDATELFAQASAARRAGQLDRAVGLLQKLQARFPREPEQLVSRMVLGRILLQQVGSPAPALEQFNAYLDQGGPLQEEALLGRALSLAKLGRISEERETWKQLLDKFPDSMHADRARARLSTSD